MCWFEGVSRASSASPWPTRGLGLLRAATRPLLQDPLRRSAYRELLGAGEVPAGLALDDHAAALFRDGAMVEAVRSRESARAFRVEAGADGVVEAALEMRFVESAAPAPREAALDEMRAIRRMRSDAGGRAIRRG